MKLKFVLTALVACAAMAAFGQARPPAPRPGMQGQHGKSPRGMMPDELKKQLKLTAAQEKKIQAVSTKYRAKFRSMFAGQQPPKPGQKPDPKKMQQMMTKMKSLRDAERKEVDAILTPKQREIMKKWRAAHPPRFGGMGGPRPAGPRGGGQGGGGH